MDRVNCLHPSEEGYLPAYRTVSTPVMPPAVETCVVFGNKPFLPEKRLVLSGQCINDPFFMPAQHFQTIDLLQTKIPEIGSLVT